MLAGLREAFGQNLVVENDVDAAALAEQAHGHGREFASFAFVWVGTGIGMGLVLDGRLHRGVHGVAGEIAFMPISEGLGVDPGDARKRGALEAAASAQAVVRAARRAGMRGPVSAPPGVRPRRPGATSGRPPWWHGRRGWWPRPSARSSRWSTPSSWCSAAGSARLPGSPPPSPMNSAGWRPVLPEVRVSALGTDAVVDGCLASGTELAWQQLLALLPSAPAPDGSGGRVLA